MRNTLRPLDALFPRTRQAILGAMLIDSGKWWYLSDLARHIGQAPSSLQRELQQLAEAEILSTRRDGNRAYFKANTESLLFPELRGLVEKTSGVVDVIRQTALHSAANRICVAFVFGSVARGEEDASSDVDLLVVGRVTSSELSPELRKAEKRLGREINAVIFPPAEFAQKVKAGNHFLTSVLKKERLFVIGGQRELDAVAGGGRGAAAHRDEDGD